MAWAGKIGDGKIFVCGMTILKLWVFCLQDFAIETVRVTEGGERHPLQLT